MSVVSVCIFVTPPAQLCWLLFSVTLLRLSASATSGAASGANFYARRPPHMLDDSQLRRQVIADQQQLVFKALAEAETVQRKASRKRSFLFIALALLGIGAWRCLAPQKRLGATLFNQAAAMSAANAPLTAADATARLTRNTLGQVVGETNETDSDIEIMR